MKGELPLLYRPLGEQRMVVDRKAWQTETRPFVLLRQLIADAAAHGVSGDGINKLVDAATFAEKAFLKDNKPLRQEEGVEKILPVVHSYRVALRLLEGTQLTPEEAVIYATIALLHDTIEDTGITRDQIENQFGLIVACGVAALTKEPEYDPDIYFDNVARDRFIMKIKDHDRIENMEVLLRMSKSKELMKPDEEGKVFSLPSGRSIPKALEHNLQESQKYLLPRITDDPELLEQLRATLTATEKRLEELAAEQENIYRCVSDMYISPCKPQNFSV